jgi:alpha-L-rhamnosidase
LGIDERRPRLSWLLESDRRDDTQTAYRVTAGSAAGQQDLWDSGRVESDTTAHVAYAGAPLGSGQQVWWTVQVWDAGGQPSDVADPAVWEMGLLDRADWTAQWIAAPAPLQAPVPLDGNDPDAGWDAPPPVHLRHTFHLDRAPGRARAYVTARGIYELSVNGRRVSDDIFTPGWTDYRKRIQYQAYDVATLLHPGENTVELVLADGWFTGKLAWLERKQYGEQTSALLQLDVDDQRVCTGPDWEAATGPRLWADHLIGEAHDARRAPAAWHPVAVVDAPDPTVALVATTSPPVRATEELAAVAVTEPAPGVFVFDVGQNMVGRVRLRVPPGPAGTTVRIRHAEMCDPDGTVYTQNLRSATATDFYVLAGDPDGEVFEPAFTFHGFRYVELTGWPGPDAPTTGAVTGIVLGSDLDTIGTFECSDPLVNQLQRNVVWGQRGNFLEAPTDCPQRDERLGWLGDAQVFVATASANMNAASFFAKWMQAVVDGQHESGLFPDVAPVVAGDVAAGAPAWADAGVIVPWTIYRCFGDRRILERHYDAMARFVDGVHEANPDHLWRHTAHDFGDWLNVDAPTPREVIATMYHAESTRLMARIAAVIDRPGDAERWHRRWLAIRDAFTVAYVTQAGRIVGHTQTAYVLALAFDLLSPAHRGAAMRYLVEDIEYRGDHLSTGFLGVGHLLPVLADNGRVDLAYRLLLQDTFPSWGYSIRHGATTIWERWDGWTDTNGFQTWHMNSFNHYSLGSVGAWLYRDVAGIGLDPDETAAGYRRAVIRPRPGGGLTHARATYRSMHGTYASAWRIEDGTFHLDVTVPPGATATVFVPTPDPAALLESGGPVTDVDKDGDAAVVGVGSGTYRFTAPAPASAPAPGEG